MDVCTLYVCGNCGSDYESYAAADECCEGEESDEGEHGPSQAELENLRQQRLSL